MDGRLMPLTEARHPQRAQRRLRPRTPGQHRRSRIGLSRRSRARPRRPGMVPKQKVSIDLTLTTPGCPSHAQITEQIRNRLAGFQELSESQVNLVWEPKWSPARISPEAQKKLGIA